MIMETVDNEIKELEARGIPYARIEYPNKEHLLMLKDAPSDLDVALSEMRRKKVITLDEFKKEFKQWRHPVVRLPKSNTFFTKHFVAQLHKVLAYYEESRGYPELSYTIFECLCYDLRRLPMTPLKDSYPTTHPKVRYISPLAVDVTFYYDLEGLTILSICK